MLPVLVFGAMLAPPPSPESAFWSWFVSNADQVATIRHANEKIADELAAHLASIDPDLTFEVGTTVPRQLVISAGGMKRAFPAVTHLVAAAPAISGWKVIAFRPRSSAHLIVVVGGYRVSPLDVWFVSSRDGEKVGLTVYLPRYAEGNTDAKQAGYLLLDSALGEYDVETKVGYIEFKAVPPSPASLGLQPFTEVSGVVDKLLK